MMRKRSGISAIKTGQDAPSWMWRTWRLSFFWGRHIVLQRFVHVRSHFQPLPTKLAFAYFDRGSYIFGIFQDKVNILYNTIIYHNAYLKSTSTHTHTHFPRSCFLQGLSWVCFRVPVSTSETSAAPHEGFCTSLGSPEGRPTSTRNNTYF